jgi:hypothetical protein
MSIPSITRISLLETLVFSGGGIFVSTFFFFRALLSLYSLTDSLFLSIPCFCAATIVYRAISHRATKKLSDCSVETTWWNSVFHINLIYLFSLLITQTILPTLIQFGDSFGVKCGWITSTLSIFVASLIVWLREHGKCRRILS